MNVACILDHSKNRKFEDNNVDYFIKIIGILQFREFFIPVLHFHMTPFSDTQQGVSEKTLAGGMADSTTTKNISSVLDNKFVRMEPGGN